MTYRSFRENAPRIPFCDLSHRRGLGSALASSTRGRSPNQGQEGVTLRGAQMDAANPGSALYRLWTVCGSLRPEVAGHGPQKGNARLS